MADSPSLPGMPGSTALLSAYSSESCPFCYPLESKIQNIKFSKEYRELQFMIMRYNTLMAELQKFGQSRHSIYHKHMNDYETESIQLNQMKKEIFEIQKSEIEVYTLFMSLCLFMYNISIWSYYFIVYILSKSSIKY